MWRPLHSNWWRSCDLWLFTELWCTSYYSHIITLIYELFFDRIINGKLYFEMFPFVVYLNFFNFSLSLVLILPLKRFSTWWNRITPLLNRHRQNWVVSHLQISNSVWTFFASFYDTFIKNDIFILEELRWLYDYRIWFPYSMSFLF